MKAGPEELLKDVIDLNVLDGEKHVPDAIGVHCADLVGAGGDVEQVDDL